MHFIPILAAAEKAHVPVLEALPYTVGALIVLATLATLWGVCSLNAKLIQVLLPAPKVPANPTPPTPSAAPAPAPGMSPELVAVVAAAVVSTMGRAHRIVSIKRQGTSWEKAGRQSILTSHKIR